MRILGLLIILLLIGFGVRWIGHTANARAEAERLQIAHNVTKKSLESVIAENKQLQHDQVDREITLKTAIERLQINSIDESCQKCVLHWD